MELELEELEATAAEDALAADGAAPHSATVRSFDRRKPVRAPLPAHLPRERIVVPAPCSCPSCGGRLAKLGEDVTETLEVIPRQWKVVQTMREKFTCRSCGEDHRAASALPPDRRRPRRARPAGDGAARQVRPASAA